VEIENSIETKIVEEGMKKRNLVHRSSYILWRGSLFRQLAERGVAAHEGAS
jgi:hypothetical protein